jgi:hypothetical protein
VDLFLDLFDRGLIGELALGSDQPAWSPARVFQRSTVS